MSLLKLPGVVDMHVHLRDPGQPQKEDFYTGTMAALFGGVTTVFDMPNNITPVMSESALREKEEIVSKKALCDYGLYFGSTGNNTQEFPKVFPKVVGLKLYLDETTGNFLIEDKKSLEKVFKEWPKTKPIVVHAEGNHVEMVIKFSHDLGNPVHITHVPGREEMEMIIEAKKMGIPVTCDATPHHLFLTKKDEEELKERAMMKPRLRSIEDKNFLWDNLSFIDCIGTDHAPHLLSEKTSQPTPFGVPGLETMVPLLLSAVRDGSMSLQDFITKTNVNPQKIFGISQNKETFFEADLDEEWTVEDSKLKTKCKWSPFDGWRLYGKPRRVVIGGVEVIRSGKLLDEKRLGKNVLSK